MRRGALDFAAGQRWLRVHDTSAFEGTDALFLVEISRPADVPITLRGNSASVAFFKFAPKSRM